MRNQFEEYSQKGMEFLKQVADRLETPEDTAYADRLTNAVLSVIRELITPEESLHMIASLPMYLKAMYVNGWKIHPNKPRLKTREEFFELLREKYPRTSGRPLGEYQSVRKDVKAVLSVMRNYINEGELRDIQAQLPRPIADLWETESFEKENVHQDEK
jgi:uncharacterized protein (DUF2267 family)